MAAKLQIVDDEGTVTANLKSTNLYMIAGTWSTSPPSKNGRVVENFDVMVKGVDDAAIVSEINRIGKLRTKCIDYFSATNNSNPVWWEVGYDTETRHALIYAVTITPKPIGTRHTQMLGFKAAVYAITLTRSEIWELKGSSTAVNLNNISTLGDKLTMSAITSGTDNPRIPSINFIYDTGATLRTFWFGMRPALKGVTNFQPKWELEATSIGLGFDSTKVADAQASGSGNNAIQCTFATHTEMATRVEIKASDVAAMGDDLIGDYLVLARMKVTLFAACGVRLISGNYDATLGSINKVYHRPVFGVQKSGAYAWYELGYISIPPVPARPVNVSGLDPGNFLLGIQATRTTGTGSDSLWMDCLALVPSTHLIKVSNAFDIAVNRSSYVYTSEKGEIWGYVRDASSEALLDISEVTHSDDWSYPYTGGVGVFVADYTGLTDQVDIILRYLPRTSMHF